MWGHQDSGMAPGGWTSPAPAARDRGKEVSQDIVLRKRLLLTQPCTIADPLACVPRGPAEGPCGRATACRKQCLTPCGAGCVAGGRACRPHECTRHSPCRSGTGVRRCRACCLGPGCTKATMLAKERPQHSLYEGQGRCSVGRVSQPATRIHRWLARACDRYSRMLELKRKGHLGACILGYIAHQVTRGL